MILTEDDLKMLFHGLGNDVGSNVGVYNVNKERELLEKEDLVTKQILENQEKAEKWDEVYKLVNDEGQTWSTIIKENKQLKDDLKNEQNKLGLCARQHDNLQQKLEKIKYRVTQFRIEDGMIQDKFAYDALREILKESEKQ